MVVVMYVRRSSITPLVIGRIQQATSWFSSIEEDLQEVDISANNILQTQIQQETEFTGYPVFYEDHLKPIGDIKELRKWYLNYKLKYANELTEEENSFELLEPSVQINEDTDIPTGYIGGTLDTLEWLVRGSSNILSPSSWFSWGSRSSSSKQQEIEFPVVQTNWYWRRKWKKVIKVNMFMVFKFLL